MSFALPPRDSELRNYFGPADLIAAVKAEKPLTVDEATKNGREFLKREPSAESVCYVAKSDSGAWHLWKVGRSLAGSLWEFGESA